MGVRITKDITMMVMSMTTMGDMKGTRINWDLTMSISLMRKLKP